MPLIEELLHLIKKLITRTLLIPLCAIPVRKNRVLLNNGLSHNYSDNPKAVAEFLRRNAPGTIELVYAVDDAEKYQSLRDAGITPVTFHSLKYFYFAVTAAVYLTNNGGYSYLPPRKKQLVIDTWHGGGAYKRCGIWGYRNVRVGRAELKLSAQNVNIFLSTSTRSSEILSQSFLLPRSIFWEIGMPRNDSLIHQDAAAGRRTREELGISDGERLVLFAPTFRRPGGRCTGAPVAIPYGIDHTLVCQALQKRFSGTWRFAFRFHPGIQKRGNLPSPEILDVSDYGDIQRLLQASDVLITDFSSSMWDFMLTGRPCFLFMPDMESCMRETGFFLPPSEWPFSKAAGNAELEQNILAFDEKKYAKACAHHYRDLGGCETGRAAQLVGERICRHIDTLAEEQRRKRQENGGLWL